MGDYTYSAGDIGRFLAHAQLLRSFRRKNWIEESFQMSHKVGNRIITRVFNFLMGTSLSDVLIGRYTLKTEDARHLVFPHRQF